MRRTRGASLGVLILALGFVQGQEQLPSPTPLPSSSPVPRMVPTFENAPVEGVLVPEFQQPPPPPPPQRCDRFWMGAEYLFWGVNRGPTFPLLTTGNRAMGEFAGALGQPTTQVLFGNSGMNYGPFSGVRLFMGDWLTADRMIGVEGSVLLLERRSRELEFRSDQIGNPALYIPAFNPVLGGERALIIADPADGFGGDFHVRGTLRFRGAEINAMVPLRRMESLTVDLLAGFRYLDLEEGLQLSNTTTDLLLGTVTTFNDSFQTRNQFYGGQIGARATLTEGPFSVALTGKLALGSNLQSVKIDGSIVQTGANAPNPGTFVGGFFAQPTNIGQARDRAVSFVPEAELRLGYEIHRGIRVYLAGTCLYWTGTARPGDQMDRTLNLSQSPIFGVGTLVGDPRPGLRIAGGDFWAYGIAAGLEFRH